MQTTKRDLDELLERLVSQSDEQVEENSIEEKEQALIEKVIYNFLKGCEEECAIPSLKEAQAIAILDAVASKYQ